MKILLSILFSSSAFAHTWGEIIQHKWKIECTEREHFCSDTDAIWEFTENDIHVTKFHHKTNVVKVQRNRVSEIRFEGDHILYLSAGDVYRKIWRIHVDTLKICDESGKECREFTKHLSK